MRLARKKQTIEMKACCLGENEALERLLIGQGRLRIREDGSYEVFSQEVRDGIGEIAQAGDYVKIDSQGYPYPNARAFFLEKHVKIGDGLYRQITSPLPVWLDGDPASDEIEYLIASGKLQIDSSSEEKYFRAVLWGAPLSAARDAAVVIYSSARDAAGQITEVDFNFVERGEFEKTYEWC